MKNFFDEEEIKKFIIKEPTTILLADMCDSTKKKLEGPYTGWWQIQKHHDFYQDYL